MTMSDITYHILKITNAYNDSYTEEMAQVTFPVLLDSDSIQNYISSLGHLKILRFTIR